MQPKYVDPAAASTKRPAPSLARPVTTGNWAAPSLEAVTSIANGLSFMVLDGIEAQLPGVRDDIIPRSTRAAQKKKSDSLTPAQSESVYQVKKVLDFAAQIFQDEDKTHRFLTRPHPMLGNRPPLDLAIESGAGADLVINILGRGAYGGGA